MKKSILLPSLIRLVRHHILRQIAGGVHFLRQADFEQLLIFHSQTVFRLEFTVFEKIFLDAAIAPIQGRFSAALFDLLFQIAKHYAEG